MNKVRPGQPLRVAADSFNAFMDAADAHRRGMMSLAAPEGGLGALPGIPVTVRNSSGADQDRYAVLEIGGIVISPTDNLRQFQSRPGFTLVLPTAESQRLVILQEPVRSGRVGEALIAGVSAVRVAMLDATHAYAKPTDGDATRLTSAAGGPFRILYAEPGTGTKWAAVYFPVTAGGSSFVRVVQITGGEDTTYVGDTVDGGEFMTITFTLANYAGGYRLYSGGDLVLVAKIVDPVEGDYWVGFLSPWAVYQ